MRISKLSPFTSAIMLASLFILGSKASIKAVAIVALVQWFLGFLIGGKNIFRFLKPGMFISTVVFFFFYSFLISEPPYQYSFGNYGVSRDALLSSVQIFIRMTTMIMTVFVIIAHSDRRDWFSLISKLGFGRAPLVFGVAFNLVPVLSSIFNEYFWYVKQNRVTKRELLFSAVRFPYVALTYSLIHSEDIHKAALARGFDREFPVIPVSLVPDPANVMIMCSVVTVNVYVWFF